MDYKTIKKGSIYWFDPNETYEYTYSYRTKEGEFHSHVQGGCRPWLVVSNDEGNESALTCNIVPLTLEIKTNIPSHVTFRMNGKLQTILCEQMRTVDICALGKYVSSISSHVQKEVDKALRMQFGLSEAPKSEHRYLEDRVSHLEQIVQELQKSQRTSELSRGLNETTKQMARGLSKASSSFTRAVSQIDKFNARLEKTKELNKATEPSEPSRPKKNTWNRESRLVYLEDCEKLSSKEIMEKYGFSKIQSVSQTKWLHKRWLSQHEEV